MKLLCRKIRIFAEVAILIGIACMFAIRFFGMDEPSPKTMLKIQNIERQRNSQMEFRCIAEHDEYGKELILKSRNPEAEPVDSDLFLHDSPELPQIASEAEKYFDRHQDRKKPFATKMFSAVLYPEAESPHLMIVWAGHRAGANQIRLSCGNRRNFFLRMPDKAIARNKKRESFFLTYDCKIDLDRSVAVFLKKGLKENEEIQVTLLADSPSANFEETTVPLTLSASGGQPHFLNFEGEK